MSMKSSYKIYLASLIMGALTVNAAEKENWVEVGSSFCAQKNILTIRFHNTSIQNVNEPIVSEEPKQQNVPIIQEQAVPEMTTEQIWQEYLTLDYVGVHQRAFDAVKNSQMPILDFWASVMWPIAITNFQLVMDNFVAKNYTVPSIDQWNVRGTAKKYNRELLARVTSNIEQQKQTFIQSL